jgi:hypothetical protein
MTRKQKSFRWTVGIVLITFIGGFGFVVMYEGLAQAAGVSRFTDDDDENLQGLEIVFRDW